MKVLIVCTYRDYAKYTNYVAPFIYEQVESLKKKGVSVDYCLISGGIKGYWRFICNICKIVDNHNADVIHAHGGLCGFVACFQHKYPVITTYHGSDINCIKTRLFAQIAILRSKWNVFVANRIKSKVLCFDKNSSVIPCGVNMDIFFPQNKEEARKKLKWQSDKKKILFAQGFDEPVKNYPLAKAAVELLPNAELVELKGYTREQVACLMNASDAALMTSFTEGSPQFVKEAMACACPVVSTDVGDVRELLEGIDNSYITTYEPQDVANALSKVLSNGNRNKQAYVRIRDNYELSIVAEELICIYKKVTGK